MIFQIGGDSMLISELPEKVLVLPEVIDELLFQHVDIGKNADAMLVFGSQKLYRIAHAINLYYAKRAPKMILSGGVVPKGEFTSEAELMHKVALERGVLNTDILIEDSSTNTKYNVKYSLECLRNELMLEKMKRIIIVTGSYHMTRALLTTEQWFPREIEAIPSPVDIGNLSREKWLKTNNGRDIVTKEVLRLPQYIKDGEIADMKTNFTEERVYRLLKSTI